MGRVVVPGTELIFFFFPFMSGISGCAPENLNQKITSVPEKSQGCTFFVRAGVDALGEHLSPLSL